MGRSDGVTVRRLGRLGSEDEAQPPPRQFCQRYLDWPDYYVTRINTPVTVGQLRIRPGDLLLADSDGCVRIPNAHADEMILLVNSKT